VICAAFQGAQQDERHGLGVPNNVLRNAYYGAALRED